MVHVTLSVLSEVHSPHPVPQLKQEVFATDKMVPLGQVVHCAPGLEQVSQLSTSVQAENKEKPFTVYQEIQLKLR